MSNPTLGQVVSLYINGDNPGGDNALLDGKTGNPPSVRPKICVGDKFTLQLFFRKPSSTVGSASTAYSLSASFGLVFSGGTYFICNSFSKSGSDDDELYQGTLDLNTAEALAALASVDTLDVEADLEYQDATNSKRVTYRIPITLCKQTYSGSPGPTASAANLFRLTSSGGMVWEFIVEDDGTLKNTRIS